MAKIFNSTKRAKLLHQWCTTSGPRRVLMWPACPAREVTI